MSSAAALPALTLRPMDAVVTLPYAQMPGAIAMQDGFAHSFRHIGNVLDATELGLADHDHTKRELTGALRQVRKASEIISHLRTFGREP